MPADIQSLKADYLRAAKLTVGDALADQLAWLNRQFLSELDAQTEVASISMAGTTSSFSFRGSTPEDRRAALRLAAEEIEGRLAGQPASVSGLLQVRLSFPIQPIS